MKDAEEEEEEEMVGDGEEEGAKGAKKWEVVGRRNGTVSGEKTASASAVGMALWLGHAAAPRSDVLLPTWLCSIRRATGLGIN